MKKNLLLIFGLITAFPEVRGCSNATIPSNTSGNGFEYRYEWTVQ